MAAAGHLAHFISDTVDQLDLSAFFERYESGGSRNQPFHPVMMVKVLVYAGKAPELVLADAGYRSEAVLEQLSDSSIEVLIALGREGKGQLGIDPAKLP
jgi:hypothetical protein